ncbi:MAG TPA: universal stress protein [Ottowia sp.]|jgi:nucleotide-binding universal stress UspA family protein|nr:universal stress protein [Burkholderiales bacterium]MBP7958328.1 universal stress protein [Ottowia sp.]MCA0312032.1 universal stress protein [Pseudomonadota bacterium]OJV53271.1 MAG: universal stress protein UspA [Burkholderiales bacterium 68-10]HMT15596.1 universal stress protein [Ottowia sp.]
MKILLAVDGSAFTKKMLAYVTTHLDLFSGDIEYTALTVQGALPPRARAAVGREVVDAYYAEESAKVLDPVVKFLTRHKLNVTTLSKVGNAGELIAKTAESGKFDLVIMGSRGHGALGSLVMGSVATKVLASCGTPVLLVR